MPAPLPPLLANRVSMVVVALHHQVGQGEMSSGERATGASSCASNVTAIGPVRAASKHIAEIDTLRAQVREFESEKKSKAKSESPSPVSPTRRTSLFDSYGSGLSSSRNGVRLDSVLYGVGSLPFFLTQMRQYLEVSRAHANIDLDVSAHAGGPQNLTENAQISLHKSYLPASQEIHFLDLFWQSHYFSYPIIKEADFRKDFKALVDSSNPGEPRKASPLIDIVLALCIQLANFRLRQKTPREGNSHLIPDAPCLAGLQYYQRCNDVIEATVDKPSLTTMLDAKLSMEIGQPPMIDHSKHTCRLPSDSPETAMWLAPHYPYDENCPTWLGFQTQTLRLVDAVRTAWCTFYATYDNLVGENAHSQFLETASTREECAILLTELMKTLDTWTRQVPAGYYVPRKDAGRPFQTIDSAPIDLDVSRNVLIHCIRQRLLLEMQYHYYCMCLYRPFICFGTRCESPTPLSAEKAVSCLNHAIALTVMIHQAMTSSEALFGIYDVYRWQKSVLFTILGFAYTFPVSPKTQGLSKTIDMAIANLAFFADTLSEAGPVVTMGRALANDVSTILSGLYHTSSWPTSSAPPTSTAASSIASPILPSSSFMSTALAATSEAADTSMSVPSTDLPVDLEKQYFDMPMSSMSLPGSDLLDFDLTMPSLDGSGVDFGVMDESWLTLNTNNSADVYPWITMDDPTTGQQN
ncbi:fungal-specific transcription factor domain-containing protein [Xylariaceae sp. FL1019]|nr:fungal-specific transcription factor domain-containing protein [Xylariaceae sp. FL1019]